MRDRVRWRQLIHCSDLQREQLKEEDGSLTVMSSLVKSAFVNMILIEISR